MADIMIPAQRQRTGTCDSCAEGDKPLPYESDDAWICEDCYGYHQRALQAATEAIGRLGTGLTLSLRERREVVSIAVKAYLEFTDEVHQFDGKADA